MGWVVPDVLRRLLLSDGQFKELKFMEACKAGGAGDVNPALAILSELDSRFDADDFLSKRALAVQVGCFFYTAAYARTRIPGAYLLRIIEGASGRTYRHPTLAALTGLSENALYLQSTVAGSSVAHPEHPVPAPLWGSLLVCHSILGLGSWPDVESHRYEAYLRGGLEFAGFPDKIPAFALKDGVHGDHVADVSIEAAAEEAYRLVSNTLDAAAADASGYGILASALNGCSRLYGRLAV